ncbi:hypothetical protein BOTCAL_0655g00020 [Botryotinia calthae]|uniref:Uncharacterized protein n=1 Tax=Botryotinia calthae TaxID=38488 RepID=A0A4Y8CIC2_9HELO|nr:hypothetical protein BOTCAL_0655g00020 [Botryotinia calthae]
MLLFVKTCTFVADRPAVDLVCLEKKETLASQKEQSAVGVGVTSGIVVVDTGVIVTVSGNQSANSELVFASTELAWQNLNPNPGQRKPQSSIRTEQEDVHVLVVLEAKHSVQQLLALVVVIPVSIFWLAGGNMAVPIGVDGEIFTEDTGLNNALPKKIYAVS